MVRVCRDILGCVGCRILVIECRFACVLNACFWISRLRIPPSPWEH